MGLFAQPDLQGSLKSTTTTNIVNHSSSLSSKPCSLREPTKDKKFLHLVLFSVDDIIENVSVGEELGYSDYNMIHLAQEAFEKQTSNFGRCCWVIWEIKW